MIFSRSERTNFEFSNSRAPLSPRERGWGRGATSGEGRGRGATSGEEPGVREDKERGAGAPDARRSISVYNDPPDY